MKNLFLFSLILLAMLSCSQKEELQKKPNILFLAIDDLRPADDFHVYGCDWSDKGLEFYAVGKEIQSVTAEELGDDWVLTGHLKIWVDSETFPWEGLPLREELPADFEIDYIRVWQKAGV